MRYFKKLHNLPVVILPGRGRVFDHDILEGAEYAQFVPMFLYEVDVQGNALPVTSTATTKPEPVPVSRVEVTHVTYPPRPAPPPALAKAWEERKPVSSTAGLQSMDDALAIALQQTVPLPEEAPAPAESPEPEIAATMEASEPPKKKRGRPRKVKPEEPPTGA